MKVIAVFCIRHGVGGLLVDFPEKFVVDWHLSRICFPLSGPCPGCEWITVGTLCFDGEKWSSAIRNERSIACAHDLVTLVATPAARPGAWPGLFQNNLLYGSDFLERTGPSGDKMGKVVRHPIPEALFELVQALSREPHPKRPKAVRDTMTASWEFGSRSHMTHDPESRSARKVLAALSADGSWRLRVVGENDPGPSADLLLSRGWKVLTEIKGCPGESAMVFLQVLGRGTHLSDLTLDYRNDLPAVQRLKRGKAPANPILLKYRMAIGTQIWKEDLLVGDSIYTHFVKCVRCGERDEVNLKVPPELDGTELDSKAFAVVIGPFSSK